MMWGDFMWWAAAAAALWVAGAAVARCAEAPSRLAVWLMAAGLAVCAAFIGRLWVDIGRPPMQTFGETRLWYALFLVLAGLIAYCRWRYRWMPAVMVAVALVFMAINLARPERQALPLMPALQSAWFVPHVAVYILAYALMACALVAAFAGWWRQSGLYSAAASRLTCAATALLTLGLLSGSLWAKSAWGDYWSWDPKETWAAATWCVCLLLVHIRLRRVGGRGLLLALLLLAFLCMQMCWYGADLLPSVRPSLHSYS